MKLTKPGQLRGFAAYPRCWTDLIADDPMTTRRGALLIVAVLSLASCDKVYFAHIDVGSRPSSKVTAVALTAVERDRAVAIVWAVASELGLHCAPTKYSIITDSYDPSVYRLSACRAEGQFTQVQLAEADDHLIVEVHQVSGMAEPTFFRHCRTRFAEALRAGLPRGSVRIQYPSHWGSRAEHGHTEMRVGRPTRG